MALYASFSAETSAHAKAVISLFGLRKEKHLFEKKMGNMIQSLFETLGGQKWRDNFQRIVAAAPS